MGWTRNKTEHARRRAICDKCETWRAKVTGYCKSCKRPYDTHVKDDGEFAAVRCKCGGEIKPVSIIERCGTGKRQPDGTRLGCGCALFMRVYSFCPKGKW